ncbi:unnamed protein product [Cunninghamella blakesleeana]
MSAISPSYPESEIHGNNTLSQPSNNNQDDYFYNIQQRSMIADQNAFEDYSEKPPPPTKKKFYKNKKFLIPCGIVSAILIVVVVCLIVFVFFPMIAQSLMNQSGIDVNGAGITFNQQNQNQKRDSFDIQSTFFMSMDSSLSNTGPFAATISFHNPINVYYNDTLLGNVTLPNTNIGGGKGELKADTPFNIQDTDYFAAFSKDMLAMESFIWNLRGKCDITALGRTATVDLNKEISIPGNFLNSTA